MRNCQGVAQRSPGVLLRPRGSRDQGPSLANLATHGCWHLSHPHSHVPTAMHTGLSEAPQKHCAALHI